MTTVLDQVAAGIWDFTSRYDWLGYYAGAGDRDNDGDPDRADLDDGNGVDCSGWDWDLVCHLASLHLYDGVPFWPLQSTAGFAATARERGWIIHNVTNGDGLSKVLADVRVGDTLIHDEHNDAFNSGGARGHTGMVLEVDRAAGTITTSESASSKNGVGFYTRNAHFWCMNIRIPLAHEYEDDDMYTDEDRARDQRIESLLGNLAKPGALHDINARLANVESLLGNLAKPGALQTIEAEIRAIKAKLGA